MSYREKQCPYCGKLHKKRGPFCSKVCSNKNRTYSDATRLKMSQSQSLAQSTPESMERNQQLVEKGRLALIQRRTPEEIETNPDNLYLPPMRDDTPDGAFRADGDLWFEAD